MKLSNIVDGIGYKSIHGKIKYRRHSSINDTFGGILNL